MGPWKNFEELEENLNLDELNLIIKAAHEREHRTNKFLAALKGIDLDKGKESDAQKKFERAQLRAQARLNGMSEEEMEEQNQVQTLTSWGFKIEKG